jgi:hypothetical protein
MEHRHARGGAIDPIEYQAMQMDVEMIPGYPCPSPRWGQPTAVQNRSRRFGGGRRHRMNGWRFYRLVELLRLPEPRIVPPDAEHRVGMRVSPLTAEASINEEPGAVVPHAWICAGDAG